MQFSSIMSWVDDVSQGLFVSQSRPLFIVVNTLDFDDFANGLCHIIAVNGGDVVTLISDKSLQSYDYVYYDAIFTLKKVSDFVEVTFSKYSKNAVKSRKKRFPLNTFGNIGNIYNLQNKT